ncbi:MAG: GH25 family lysozyme [Eubacterium sp.]
MKKTTKIISVLLAAVMIFQSGMTASAAVKLKSKYTNTTYTHQSRFDGFDISYGIDVSQHNGDIDFKKVKADGIDYVFVRVGYTGYTKSSFSLNYDTKYKTYIRDAKAAGLDVGVYWYSQALTANEAVQEATKLLKAISSYEITMPVVFDYEFACTSAGRLDSANLSKARMTANALAFLDTVAAAGYNGCLYASENFLLDHLNADEISSLYTVWLANYSTKTTYAGDFEYWQHTAKGKVSGITGNVDINFRYTGDVYDIENQTYTGMPVTPEPTVDFNGATLIKDIDYTLVYSNNINVGYGIVDAVGIGAYDGFKKRFRFKIAPQKVEGLTFASNSKDSLTYTWNSVPGATSYRIYVTNNTNPNVFTKTVTTNSATLSGLTQGNEYSVKVSAGGKNSDGTIVWGPYSDIDTKATQGIDVTGLKVKSRSTSSIRITWNKLAVCDLYVIYIYNDRSKQYEEIARILPTSNNYKIEGLKAGTVYKFRVSAIKDGKEGKKSNYVKTAASPKKASVKSAKSSSKKKITVKWKNIECSGYQVQWSTKKNFSSNYKTVNVDKKNLSKTIKTAQSKKRYYVRVRAYTKAGGQKIYGAWSSVKSVYVK